MKRNRIDFEKKALRKMICMYCKGYKHGTTLCRDCQALLDYALQRLDACVFGDGKTFCSSCTVHCYEPVMRERIKKAMRYSGPRMLYRDPLTAFMHILKK